MKSRKHRILLGSIAAVISATTSGHAAIGTWNVDANGNWGTAGSWNPAVVPGTAAGDVINLTNNISAARTVTIDTTSRTAGDLNIGDSAATLFGFTLASSGTAVVLNLDGTGTADATIDFTAAIANTISAPLTLVDNAVIRSNTSAVQTLSGIISGASKTLTFNNDTDGVVNAAGALNGQFVVSGANTYSGGTTVSDVRVQVTTSNAALGTGAVNVLSGGQIFASGAQTFANTFNIAGNGWVETAANQPFGALRLEGNAIISGGVVMNADSAVGNNTGTGTINGVVSGGVVLSKRGGGTIVLGNANTYGGGTNIVAGSIQANNAGALGSGTVTFSAGSTGRLFINGGVAIGNSIFVDAGVTNAVGQGLLQQTGTGQAVVNGTITLNGAPTNGGTFVGGLAVGNELVLNGVISGPGAVSQRDGRVIYRGGGTGYTSLTTTNAVIVGATNGIATTAVLKLGGSGNSSLEMNGFNQTLASLELGNGGANSQITGTVNLGGNTLTLNGDVTTVNLTSGHAYHTINATAGGTVAFGATPRNISVSNSIAADDLVVNGAALTGAGLTKIGAGTLALNDASITGGLSVNAGTLAAGRHNLVSNFTTDSLAFGPGATGFRSTINAASSTSSQANVTALNGLATNGTATVSINQLGGLIPNGTYTLINYNNASPIGLAGFAFGPSGHITGTLIDTGTAIQLNVQGNDRVVWDGTNSTAWATGATGNWKLQSTAAQTDYVESDEVVFQDSPLTATADIAAPVNPSKVNFSNTTTTAINITGTSGIVGSGGVSKTGNGVVNLGGVHQYSGPTNIDAGTLNLTGTLNGTNVTVGPGGTLTSTGTITGASGLTSSGTTILRGANTYTGSTDILAGTLELDHDGGTLTATSGINLAAGATLKLTRDGTATAATTTFSRSVTGAGTIEVNLRTGVVGTVADSLSLTGNNTGHTGTLRLLSPASGTYRVLQPAFTAVGTGPIEVQNGAQFYTAASVTHANDLTITGTGFADANGNIGALRLENGATWAGNIVVTGAGARIGAHSSTGTVSGSISGGPLEVNVSNYPNAYTIIFTGANSYTSTVIGGVGGAAPQTTANIERRLNIGNGGTTGTLGSGPVTIVAEGVIGATNGTSGALGFDRSDGYTLGAGNTITAAGGNLNRTIIDFDTRGAGFSDNGNSIILGSAAPASGGIIRMGQTRAGTLTNINGTLTAEKIQLSGTAAGINPVMNIGAGATVTANFFTVGEVANGTGGVVNQNGGTVNVLGQLRAGHFGTETGTYNMNGGTLTLTGASTVNNPNTAGSGGAGTTGDNNIEAFATATIHGGGIYLGIDGQGIFNHNSGTVTTNWIVLDNRGDTGIGANMGDGIDRYNLNSGVLNLRSTWGIKSGNATTAVSFAGGTVRVDNSGTGGAVGNTGANLNIPLDANITVSGAGTTLDTNGAGNGFTLTRTVNGTAPLKLSGGGTLTLNNAGFQVISPALVSNGSGVTLTKLGAGLTSLTGSGAGFTGVTNVSAGVLEVPSNLASPTINVADTAALAGEPTATTVNLGVATGSVVYFNPNTAGALTAGSLNMLGTTTLDFATTPETGGPWTAIKYTSKTGALPVVANAGTFRNAPVVNDTGNSITVDVPGIKLLSWTGLANANWNNNTDTNWNDGAVPQNFFTGDIVVFPEGGLNSAVSVASGVIPWGTTITSNTTDYTLTSAGVGIAGPGGIVKSGNSTLILAGTNTYRGTTVVNGGTLSISNGASLGLGSNTNGIDLSNGARITATAALNTGTLRGINIGSGGGILAMSNAAAQTVTVAGNLTGSAPLTFNSMLAGGGTFSLTGLNSGYTGDISVTATSTGLTTLQLANQPAVPNASSITVNYPAAGASGNANILNLPGVALPAATTLIMTSLQNGATSLRSQVTSSGTSAINGPLSLSGSAIVQFNVAAAGTLTFNGPIGETTPGAFAEAVNAFSNVLFLRGTGTSVINGSINLPSAGSTIAVTDGAIAIVNSTGNVARSSNSLFGVLRIGANDALPVAGRLVIGQAGDQAATMDLNGFNQTVQGLEWQAPTGNLLTKGISNSHPTATSTFTVNQTTAPASSFNGTFSGRTNLVKEGAATLTLQAAASTFSGNVTVNAGTLVATSLGAANGSAGTLGVANLAGRTVTVNPAGTLSFTSNNIFGNGVGNNNLPAITLNGGTLTSTRYNVLGALALNGATLTQAATDGPGVYEGYQFRGDVTVGGSTASVISTTNGRGNHLAANTLFNVANATGDGAADLVVSTALKNQSGDFGSATGGLTKSGSGTMELTAASSYTGTTTVNAGTLRVTGSISGSTLTTVNATGILSGAGSVGALDLNGGTLSPGTGPGILTANGSVDFGGGSFAVEINGTTAGTQFDQLAVLGLASSTVTISAPTSLDITLGFTPSAGDRFMIVSNDGPDAVVASSLFTVGGSPIADGGAFSVSGTTFQLDYTGGDGNDIELIAVPEPGSAALLLGGLAMLAGRRRRRA